MLIALFFVTLTLAVAAFLFPQQVLTVDSGETKADALVVLGGGDGRAERAAELYQQGTAPTVVVTGCGDCDANVEILENHGVPRSVIVREPNALTTLQNAQFSIPLLRLKKAQRVIIVTSWFHSRRALACFEHFAPEIKFYSRPSYANPLSRNYNWKKRREYVNIEYAKIMLYWIRNGISPF